MRHRRDAGQSLPAKPHRPHVIEVFGFPDLAGGVAFDGQKSVLLGHPVAVVLHLDSSPARRHQPHHNARRTRIQRVLDQLLDYRRRTLDNLARRDLVGQILGQNPHRRYG
jgi:hypothetical protein